MGIMDIKVSLDMEGIDILIITMAIMVIMAALEVSFSRIIGMFIID